MFSNDNYTCSTICMEMTSSTWRIPSYQRSKVWSNQEKNMLVDSILLGINIGQIQLYIDDICGYKWINEGQQRCTTITDFQTNIFKFTDPYGNFPELKGKHFKEWPVKYQNTFRNYSVNANTIPEDMLGEYDSTTDSYSFPLECYIRTNTHGCKMNEMEILKATNDSLTQLINRTMEEGFVQKFIKRSNKRGALTKVIDACICKAYILSHHIDVVCSSDSTYMKYVHSMVRNGEISQDELDEIEKKAKAIFKVIGKNYINKVTQNIGSNAIDGLFIVLFNNKFPQSLFENNQQEFSNIFDDYLKYCGRYTSSGHSGNYACRRESIEDRIEKAAGMFQEFIPKLDSKRMFTKEDRQLLWESRKHICEECGCVIDCIEDMDVDHIIPWSLGGKTTLENARITCQHCNRSKGNRM